MWVLTRTRRLGVALVLVVIMAIGMQPHAHALDAGGTVSQLAKLAPVAYPASVALASGMGAGTGGLGIATGIAGVGALPLLGGVVAAAAVGGLLYVGYRQLSGNPIEWWWQDGEADPGLVESVGIDGWSYTKAGHEYVDEVVGINLGGVGDQPTVTTTPGADGFHPFVSVRSLGCPGYSAENWNNLRDQSGTVTLTTQAGIKLRTCGIDYINIYPGSLEDRVYDGSTLLREWYQSLEEDPDAEYGQPGWGGDPGVQAVTKTRVECTDTTTGASRWIEAVSDPYGPADEPAALPDLECAQGERISDVELWREAPGVDPLKINEPLQFPPVVPAPSTVPTEMEDLWDDCFTGACVVEVHRLDPEGEPQRKLAPPGDIGWHLDADRIEKYGCFWSHPGGALIPLPLEECWGLQWEWDPETGEPVMPVPDPTELPDLELNPPTLEQPTPTGSAQGCEGSTESGFLGSRIIARAIKCALVDLFVPTQLQVQVTQLEEEASERVPFVAIPIGQELVTGFGEGWDSSCGALHSFWPYTGTSGELRSTSSFDARGSLPCTPAHANAPTWQTAYALVSAALVIGTAISMFSLTSRALKGPD